MIAALFKNNTDSPGFGLFKLGEAKLVDLYTSNDALNEANAVLSNLLMEDFSTVKVLLAENLAMANVAIASIPNDSTVSKCEALTKYRPDARILAAAIERDCEVLVTYDKQHLLNNPHIGPPNTRLVVMSGGEALDWAKDQISVRSRLRLAEAMKRTSDR